jgi:hypothetical protein
MSYPSDNPTIEPDAGPLPTELVTVGHDRDGEKNKLQVNYRLLTTRTGCPAQIALHGWRVIS